MFSYLFSISFVKKQERVKILQITQELLIYILKTSRHLDYGKDWFILQ